MTKVKLGNKTFDASKVTWPTGPFGVYDFRLRSAVDRVRGVQDMRWNCSTATGHPDPFPSSISVQPHLLVYRNPQAMGNPSEEWIDAASQQAGLAFLKNIGLPDAAALNKAMVTQFGIHKVALDVDAAIARLKPTFSLKIRVIVEFMHFRLYGKAADHADVILSLPDRLVIEADETHVCAAEGHVQSWGRHADLVAAIIPAASDASWQLRKTARKKERRALSREIEQLQERVERVRKDAEASKPAGD